MNNFLQTLLYYLYPFIQIVGKIKIPGKICDGLHFNT